MTWLLIFSLLGVAVARMRGGSFAGWARAHVYWSAVALASLGLQLVLFSPPVDHQPWAIAWGPLVWVVCLLALGSALVRNAIAQPALRIAWTVAALGVGLNVLVVSANGGYMPQSEAAHIATRGTSASSETGQLLRNVEPMSDDTHLNVLGDVIPEPAWLPKNNVISLGDLLLGLGLALWAFQVTAASPRTLRRVQAV